MPNTSRGVHGRKTSVRDWEKRRAKYSLFQFFSSLCIQGTWPCAFRLTQKMNLTAAKDLQIMARKFQERTTVEYVVHILAWCCISLVSFIGNLLTLILLSRNRQLWTSTNMLIASMAVSDFLYVVCAPVPLTAPTLVMSKWPFPNIWCQFQGIVIFIMNGASIQTLAWTAGNRFYRVVKPASYKRIFSRKRTAGIIAMTWLFSMFVPILYLSSDHEFIFHPAKFFCYVELESGPMSAAFFLIYVSIPMALICYCYLRVYLTIRTHNAQIQESNTIGTEEIKITKLLVVILLAFMCCWTPILLVDLVDFFTGQYMMPQWVYVIYTFLGLTSSSINPIIYVTMNQTFRKEYLKLLRCCCYRNNQVAPSS